MMLYTRDMLSFKEYKEVTLLSNIPSDVPKRTSTQTSYENLD
jgi:hypothetical protein